MKKIILLLLITNYLPVASLAPSLFAQSQFQVSINGMYDDLAFSVIQTTDGGYAAAGYTNSFGGFIQPYIVKLDRWCYLHWSKAVGGIGNFYTYSIIQTADGGYALAGSNYQGDNYNFYILKLDAGGNFQWNRLIGGPGDEIAYSITQTADGGYAAAGYTTSFGAGDSNMYVVKLDGSGNFQWSKTIGGTGRDFGNSIVRTSDGGYAVAGGTNSFGAGSLDVFIVKLDANGSLQWSRTVGTTSSQSAYSIIQTADGGYAAAGSANVNYRDVYVVKLDAGGSLQWTRYVNSGIDFNDGYSIVQTADGGFAVAGSRDHVTTYGRSGYVVKLDSGGLLQWHRFVGPAVLCSTCITQCRSIARTDDGGYVLAVQYNGTGNFDFYIIKLDAGGNSCPNTTTPSGTNGTIGALYTSSPVVTSPSPTVSSPSPSSINGGIITLICLIGIQPISNEIPSSFQLYQNFPNPFNPVTKIKFDIPSNVKRETSNVKMIIYDLLGRVVATLVNEELKPGTYEVEWPGSPSGRDASNYPSGAYYYQLTSGDFKETRRMVLIK